MRSIGDLKGWGWGWASAWSWGWAQSWRYWYYTNKGSDTETLTKRLT